MENEELKLFVLLDSPVKVNVSSSLSERGLTDEESESLRVTVTLPDAPPPDNEREGSLDAEIVDEEGRERDGLALHSIEGDTE